MHLPEFDTNLATAVAAMAGAGFGLLNTILSHLWRKKDDKVKQAQTEMLRENTNASVATAQLLAERENLTVDEMLEKAASGWERLRQRRQVEDQTGAEAKVGRR